MKIAICNQQKHLRLNIVALRRLTSFFLERLARGANLEWGELSLVLTDDAGITAINRVYLDSADVTDVIAFPLQTPRATSRRDGEIFVNTERALTLYPRAPARELALYVAHGCNHLAGGRDHTDAGRRRMRQKENALLAAAERAGLLQGILLT